jgi:hypothetical protein
VGPRVGLEVMEKRNILSLCLINYHIMSKYGVVEVKINAFLTSAQDENEWSA